MMTKTNGAKPQMIEVVEEKENMVVHSISTASQITALGFGYVHTNLRQKFQMKNIHSG